MALSATFAADFSAFTQACTQAEISLKGIESGAGKVEGQLTKMGDSLSGTKIIQQAAIMAEAVERVGGVSTLTAKELQRVGGTAEEAAEKLRKLGQDVPPGIQKIADASIQAREELAKTTQSGTAGFETLGGKLKELAALFGIAFGAGAVIGLMKNIIGGALDMADAIDNTTKKLGVSAEKWQGWVAAAELGGATAEDVTAAVSKMNINLDEGSKQTVSALERIGLSWKALRDMKGEEAFETIVTALMKIPDPMERARAAVEIGGKSMLALLPAISDDMVKVGESAQKMSNETVARLAEAQNAWKTFTTNVTIWTGEMLGHVMSDWAMLAKNSKYLWADITHPFQGLGQAMAEADRAMAAAKVTQDQVAETAGKVAAATHKSAEELKAEEDALKKNQTAWEAHRQAIQGIADLLTGRHVAQEMKDLREAFDLASRQGGLTAEGWKVLYERLQKLVEAGAALDPVLLNIWAKHVSLHDIVPKVDTGLGNLAKTLPDVTDGFKKSGEAEATFLAGLQGLVPIVTGLPKDLLKIAESVDLSKTGKAMEDAFKKAQEAHQRFVDTVSAEGFKLLDGLTHGWDSFKSAVMSVLDDLLVYFERKFVAGLVASMLGGTSSMGGMFSGLLSSGGSAGAGAAVSGGTGAGGGTSAAAAAGAGASTALIAAGVAGGGFAAGYYGAKAIDAWMTNEGRNVVQWFANVYGGFDKLHEKLSTLGAQGEQLWITLTQGTGNKSPQQAQATIHLIEQAFKDAQQAAQDATDAADDFAAAVAGAQTPEKQAAWIDHMLEVGSKLGLTFEDLSTEMKQIKENQAFQTLTDEMNAAIRAGFDTQAVLKGSADEWQALIDHAKKYGLEVPLSMKPTLQKLVDMGLLVDANGVKLDDLSSIHFAGATTAADTFGRHGKDAMEDVLNAADRATGAVAAVGSALDPATFRFHTQPEPSAANEGFFASPQLVRVGDDPYGEGEYVLHKRTVEALLRKTSGTGGVLGGGLTRGSGGTVIVELNGRLLAQVVVPELEGEIRRLGFGR